MKAAHEVTVRIDQCCRCERSFGKTSLREVKRKLTDMNLSLGMELPEEMQAGV